MTTVVNKRKQAYDVYIGRGSIWGNPYVIGKDGTRAEVLFQYKAYLESIPELLSQVYNLRGKVLGCYCAPLPCHGDILAEYANSIF